MRPPFKQDHTHYQQKWKSKSVTRAYHGEKIKESHWHRIFHRTMRSVVTMPASMGRTDGSEHGAGRGSGLVKKRGEAKPAEQVPYMNMVYAPMERRLDTAIFRAMFASSVRQARQFVVHGYVKVNGKKVCALSHGAMRKALTNLVGLPWIHAQPRRHVPS